MENRARFERRHTQPDGISSDWSGNFTHVRKVVIARQVREVTFRAVQQSAMLMAACELLNDRYGWRGYGSSHSIPSGVHHTTFTAEVDETVVGTITLAIDSELGLAVDRTFADDVGRIRDTKGTQICELTRLAFREDIRSKEVLASLFHFTFIVGTAVSSCTDLLIEVSPRHTDFYHKMLGFERVGSMKTNHSVGSPSQLMRLRVDAIGSNIRTLAGALDSRKCYSLYPYFLNMQEERQIRRAFAAGQKRGNEGGVREAAKYLRQGALQPKTLQTSSSRQNFEQRDTESLTTQAA